MKNCLYFFIYYPRDKQEIASNIEFIVPEKESDWPELVFSDEKFDKNFYNYKKIYKINKSKKKGKKENKYHFEFELDDDKYIIAFDSGGCNFVHDVKLEVVKELFQVVEILIKI